MEALFRQENLPSDESASTKLRLRTLTIILMLAAIGGIVVDGIIAGFVRTIYILSPIVLLLLVGLYLIQQNRFLLSRIILPISTLAATLLLIWEGNGLHDIVMLATPMVIIISGLTLGSNAQVIFGILTFSGLALIGIGEINGTITNPYSATTSGSDIIVVAIILFATAFLQRTLIGQLTESVKRAQRSEQEQIRVNEELRELQATLENRIAEHTTELERRSKELADRTVQLELVNIRAQRRASQLQAISDVAKTISTIRSLNELLPRITKAVSEQFGFYHVGIFLTDENNRYAILSATNSEGGQRMLARGHRLEVGGQGIVGHVTSTGNPRIALDTGTDAAHFSNPDLPDTHSEMAFPLKVGGRVIGALDIQSNQVNAFSQEDVDALATLADQISIAIETARLFETTQKSIAEAETLYRQYLREGWSLVSQKEIAGFRYSAVGATPLDAPMQQEEIQAAASTGQIMMGTGDRAFVAIPIKLRDEIIGVLNIQTPGKRVWKNEEISMVQAIADRIAVSAENARLFEESQQRATKERIIGEISSKISSSVNLENVMQTAAEELGRALSNSEVTIQFKKS